MINSCANEHEELGSLYRVKKSLMHPSKYLSSGSDRLQKWVESNQSFLEQSVQEILTLD